MKKIIYLLILPLLAISCITDSEEGNVVAVAYDNKIYESDLASVTSNSGSAEDSLLRVSVYLNNWMQEQSILHKAILSYDESEKERSIIDKRVEAYKNSLIVYNFERKYISIHLDTIVKFDEIEEFYNTNKKEFILKDDIVQVAFIKFYSDEKNLKTMRRLMKSYEPEDIVRIKSIADETAINYLLEADTWILFDDLIKEIPLQTYNKSLYLKNNKYLEIKDSVYTYMLRVNQYRIRDNYSPLSFEEDRIRGILINIRKMEMVEKLREDIFEESQKNGKIKLQN
ncbi:MAG: hypothetical protein KAG84_03895 [Bacteroidales bacterium]|nr:hypothetical protein [Bacteroidales bacterium]